VALSGTIKKKVRRKGEKMKPEIVKALKENTSAFGLMSPELRDAMSHIDRDKFLYYHCGGNWRECSLSGVFGKSSQYRLRPDYQLESEYEKFEIKVREHGLMYISAVSCQNFPDNAIREPNFAYFALDDLGTGIGIEDIATKIRQGHKVYAVFVK
jgi:hypothetical protein